MKARAPKSDRQHIEELQEEILWLRGELGLLMTAEQIAEAQRAFRLTIHEARILLHLLNSRLTIHEARILLHLLNSRLMTKENAMNVLSEAGYDYEADDKIVDVYVCKVRAKLKRRNIGNAIQTVWGNGYYLDPVARGAIAAALSQPWRGMDE